MASDGCFLARSKRPSAFNTLNSSFNAQWISLTTLQVKRSGQIPPEHYSHDHLNPQTEVPIKQEVIDRWKEKFTEVEAEREKQGEQLLWVLVDGFLLYWNAVSGISCNGLYIAELDPRT